MKLALFNDFLPGLVSGERIVDLSDLVGDEIMGLPPRHRMPALIAWLSKRDDPFHVGEGSTGVPLGTVRLRAPVPRPGKILVALTNHREGIDAATRPANVSLKSPSSILDPGGDIELPTADAVTFHHEAQIAAVIGIAGNNIAAADAMDHVFGYAGVININARGLGFGLGIDTDSFDTFTPFGPWIATADEIRDPGDLAVTLRVNGELREDYSTADMAHSFAELIAFVSRLTALEPGDMILSGACYQGVGPVQDGDALELRVEGLGALEARVRDPLRRRWPIGVDAGLASAVRDARLSGTPIPFKTHSVQRIG